MNVNLKSKVVFITGGAQGLGAHMALDLAKQGAVLVINYKNSEKQARALLKRIKKFSPRSIALQADLTKKQDVNRIFKQIFTKFNKVDVLINNIGNFIYKSIDKTSPEEVKEVMESNIYTMFSCTKKVLPRMKKQKFGKIINFGCAGCERLTVREHTTPYYLAKSGVYMLSKALAEKYAKYNININCISPGILESSVVKIKTPTGDYIKFKDINNVVLFLLSQEAQAVNGANIEVAGAWLP